MDTGELFLCCRTGNLSRIRFLVEEKDVDLSARDKWGGTPLYYACLCGHYEVVLYLLQNGVQCDANTFDGERCLYGALTDNIRHLLLNFKVISAVTMRRDKYSEFLRRTYEISDYSDVEFMIENKKILAHRSILTSRSKYFHHLFCSTWMNRTFIDLTDLNISSGIFKHLLQYLYMGQISIHKKDIKAFITLSEHFQMTSIVTEIRKILSSKKKISVLYVQPKPLPQQDFMKLFLSSLPKVLQLEGDIEELLYVDLHIKVENQIFFCHKEKACVCVVIAIINYIMGKTTNPKTKVFLCGRCSYLKALVTDHFSETSVCDDNEIQVITLHHIDPQVFVKILQYIYTETADLSAEIVLDVLCFADIFILPGLKKLCASVIQENLTTDNVIPIIKLVRLYNLPRLENQCAEFMAEHIEEIIDLPEFKNLILDDANEIKNRQEVDTISVIDDIRYHIERSERVSNGFEKHLLITELLENLKLEA